jgi:hypothetical protein
MHQQPLVAVSRAVPLGGGVKAAFASARTLLHLLAGGTLTAAQTLRWSLCAVVTMIQMSWATLLATGGARCLLRSPAVLDPGALCRDAVVSPSPHPHDHLLMHWA